MICDRCRIVAVEYPDKPFHHVLFSPNCEYCNARHIQLVIARAQKYGCDVERIWDLAKKAVVPVQPQEGKGRKK